MCLSALLLLAPFAWMLYGAASLASFARVFEWVPMHTALFNSLLLTTIAVALTWLFASLTGFAMTRLSRERQTRAVVLLIVAASIPATALLLPRFALFQSLGIAHGLPPLLAPALYGASPLYVLLYFLSFKRIPVDYFDAARLEGLSTLALWWRVALPLAHPASLAIATLAAMQFWGGFQEPLLYLKQQNDLTAPLMLHALDLLGPTQWPVLMAGALLVTAPVVLAFVAAQGLFRGIERAP